MIEQILDDKLAGIIVERIRMQFYQYQKFAQLEDSLYYGPYTKVRKKHGLTAAVLSGFAPDRFMYEGIEVVDIQYGLHDQLGQPEIHHSKNIIQIYSSGSDLTGKPIKERSVEYNKDLSTMPNFLIIVFSSNPKRELTKIEAHLPNGDGAIIETKVIYDKVVSLEKAV